MGILSLPKPERLGLSLSLVAKRQFHNKQSTILHLKILQIQLWIFCKEQSFHHFFKKSPFWATNIIVSYNNFSKAATISLNVYENDIAFYYLDH